MFKTHCDEIVEGDNVVIGLGDSFTQGIGAYSLESWQSIPKDPASYNLSGQHFLPEQGANSWVRQLSKKLGYKTYNLGVNGAGNRAAVRELYLNPLPKNLGNVIVILMATGLERYDFIKPEDTTTGINWHQKWQTIFPIDGDRGPISNLEREYMKVIHSTRNDAFEFLFNVCDAENFCKARGWHFLFASAFDHQINRQAVKLDLKNKSEYIDIADWDNFVSIDGRKSFMDMIFQMEGHPPTLMYQIFDICRKLKVPGKYVTPCSHWSIEGNNVVAEYLLNEIKSRGLA